MRVAHFEFDDDKDRLGEGPLSFVFKAVDQHLGRTVALKILKGNAEIDPAADHRFLREAKHTSSLQHPNIATIYEYGEDERTKTSYIALEYLEGRTLDRILKDQTLGYEECLRIALQLTSALALVHRTGLIHRDLKPGNIMVLHDGTVKLLDFGIARAGNESSITQHGVLVGTVLYMSPEQVRGDELTVRSDIFALGSVAYHMMTGALPFPGKSFPEVCMSILDGKPKRPSQVRLGFPPVLEAFVNKCLDPEPSARYADAGAAHGALLALADQIVPSNGTVAAPAVSGAIWIPPVKCGGANQESCSLIAGGMRKDLAGELSRIKGLAVTLSDAPEPPPGSTYDYLLRLALEVEGHAGTLDLDFERYSRDTAVTPPKLREMLTDRVEYASNDDWDLQAGLVRVAVRTVRKRLTEIALRPVETIQRNTVESRAHALHAHETLHKGTTKHLLASISSFRRAIDADPYCAIAYAGLAEAMVRKYLYWDGDTAFLDEARQNAARALALDPKCAEAHTSLGFAWHVSGHITDAQREYQIALEHDQREWLAHRLLGAALARAGNFKNAAPHLRIAIGQKPSHIGSYDHLYGVLQRLNRYEEALEIAEQGIGAARAHISKVPDHQEARLHMAMLQARLGLADDAHTHVRKACEIAPKDGYTAFHAACVHAILGETGEAVELLRQAQARGYFIQSELARNTDLDVLRGLTEFQRLVS